jgi:hypothetical protein
VLLTTTVAPCHEVIPGAERDAQVSNSLATAAVGVDDDE